jgi:hypothetical protein
MDMDMEEIPMPYASFSQKNQLSKTWGHPKLKGLKKGN